MENLKSMFKMYFIYLNEHVTTFNTYMDTASKQATIVTNLTDQWQVVTRANINDEMLKVFPDIRNRLIGRLHLLLEDELEQLNKIQETMNTRNRDLRKRLVQLEQCYKQLLSPMFESDRKIFETNLVEELDPRWPPYGELLEMACDSWRYYHDLWVSIHVALNCIDYENAETITNLKNVFKEDLLKKKHITGVLLMTRFLVEPN